MTGTLYSETDSQTIKRLYEESVERTIPRANSRRDASPAITGDGGAVFDSYAKAEKYYREALFARKKMGDRPKKFPIISAEYAKNIPKIPFLWGISMLSGYGMSALEDSQNAAGEIVYGLLGMANALSTQLYKSHFTSGMPLVAAYKGFAEGQTKIPRMGTVKVGEFEMPVFKYPDTLAGVTDIARLVKDNFEIKGKRVISRFNKSCGEWVNRNYIAYSIEKEMRGDYRDLIDPSKANPWVVRNYTGHMQESGPILDSATITLPGNGSLDLKTYGRSSVMSTFAKNLVGDIVYDIFDAPFDALHAAGFEVIPPGAQQQFKDLEYKSIRTAVRGITGITRGSGRKKLTYDLPLDYVRNNSPAIYLILTS